MNQHEIRDTHRPDPEDYVDEMLEEIDIEVMAYHGDVAIIGFHKLSNTLFSFQYADSYDGFDVMEKIEEVRMMACAFLMGYNTRYEGGTECPHCEERVIPTKYDACPCCGELYISDPERERPCRPCWDEESEEGEKTDG